MTPESPPVDDPRSVRLDHLRTESGIKSVGQLCYLVTFFSALGTLEFSLFALGVIPYDKQFDRFASPDVVRVAFGIGAVFLLVNAAFLAAIGYGLTHLQAWARWTVVALTGLSLVSHVGFSVALCFSQPSWGLASLIVGGGVYGLILYPLLTPGAGVVFSGRYREIIRATPEIRSRMHWLLKLFIGLIVAGVVGFAAYLIVLIRS
jgi:hypothetical protein